MKKIIVCIKCVNASLFLNNSDKSVAINPFDVFSMHQAKELKKSMPYEIICITMGKKDNRVAAELRMLGADQIIFLQDPCFAGSDTYATSRVLAEAIKKIHNYQFVFCGDHAIDGETGHVSSALAHRLNIEMINNVNKLEVINGEIIARTQEASWKKQYALKEKLLVCFSECDLKEITLNIMQIRKIQSIEYIVWGANEINVSSHECGQIGSKTKVCSVSPVKNSLERTSMELQLDRENDLEFLINMVKGNVHGI